MPIAHVSTEATEIDLLVIGGGCAGLSLSSQLCALERQGRNIPQTLILEPRREYNEDRSWCYWTDASGSAAKTTNKQWSSWEFSDASNSCIHSLVEDWVYEFQNSGEFYESRLAELKNSARVSLRQNEDVQDVFYSDSGFEVTTKTSNYRCKKIFDTRPPTKAQLETAILRQVFFGVEVETTVSCFERDTHAKVMADMSSDEDGFKFNYILPISATRHLVELTKFTAKDIEPGDLRDATYQLCEQLFGSDIQCVHREEAGCIPMGLPDDSSLKDPNWVRIGIGGGAARPSTGYAFKRIQAWADETAEELCESARLMAQPKDRFMLRWMDRIFLLTVRHNPDLAPQLFMSIAKNLAPVRLVRFLSDQPTSLDLLAIIWSLPKAPLLKTAFTDGRTQIAELWGRA